MKRFTLVGAALLAVGLSACSIHEVPTVSDKVADYYSNPPTVQAVEWPMMAIVGDSFAVDERGTSWMRRTAWCAAHQVTVSGGLGTGFWNDGDNIGNYRDPDRMNPVLAGQPRLVILESSYNDSFRAERYQDEVRDAIVQTVDAYRAIVPDAKFVIVGPIWAQKPNTVGVENNRLAMREAAAIAGVTYIDAIDWLPNPGFTGTDGKHPNEQGHMKLTAELIVALKDAGLVETTGGCESLADNLTVQNP